jgi:DNA polymerase-4/protein ImuB
VLVDHFPFKVEAARDPRLAKRRAIVFTRSGSRRTVLDVSPAVEHVTPGMSLQEAQARCKDAALVEADMPGYERAFGHMLLRLGNRSPVVEAAGLGCAYIGLDGLEDTYGSEARLIDSLLHSVPQHFEPRLGVSRGRFYAYLAALAATPGWAYRPPGELKDFVAPLSVDVLPVPWEVKRRLHGFGLHTLGQVAALPLGPLQAQFGPTGAWLWRLSCGVDSTPLVPERPHETVSESISLPEPTTSLGAMLMVVESLLGRLFEDPSMRGRLTRSVLLEGRVLNRPPWQRRFVFKTPVGDSSRAYAIIRGLLDNLSLPGPLEEVCITLGELGGESGRQGGLFLEARQRDRIREAIAGLKVSFGQNPIYRVREVEPWSRIPERRAALMPYEP